MNKSNKEKVGFAAIVVSMYVGLNLFFDAISYLYGYGAFKFMDNGTKLVLVMILLFGLAVASIATLLFFKKFQTKVFMYLFAGLLGCLLIMLFTAMCMDMWVMFIKMFFVVIACIVLAVWYMFYEKISDKTKSLLHKPVETIINNEAEVEVKE